MSARGSSSLIDAERLRVYPRIFLVLYGLAALGLVLSAKNGIDPFGKPLGYDFLTFYSAAKLTLAGHAAEAFDIFKIFAAQKAIVPANEMAFQWTYPPTFQLLVTPLGLVPYGLAYFIFVGASLAAYGFALSRLPAARPYLMALLAAPGVMLCVFHGQNALLSAALFAGGMAFMDRRPFLAGLVLAGLAYKPQLGLLLPVALAASGQVRAFLGASIGVIAFSGVATAVFGTGLWHVFFEHTPFVQQVLRSGMLPWAKIPSAFVFCRVLGLSEAVAMIAQAVTALGAVLSVAVVFWRQGASPLAWAVLVPASLLVSPYMFDYELVLLVIPIALLAQDYTERGARLPEKAGLLVLYALPLVMAPVATVTHLQIGYLGLLLALGLALKRAVAGIPAQRPARAAIFQPALSRPVSRPHS